MFPSYSLTNRLPMWHNIRSFSEVQMVKLSHKRQRLAFVLEKKKSCYLPEKYIYQARLTESICMKSAWFYPIFLDFCFGVASRAELLLRPTCGYPKPHPPTQILNIPSSLVLHLPSLLEIIKESVEKGVSGQAGSGTEVIISSTAKG